MLDTRGSLATIIGDAYQYMAMGQNPGPIAMRLSVTTKASQERVGEHPNTSLVM